MQCCALKLFRFSWLLVICLVVQVSVVAGDEPAADPNEKTVHVARLVIRGDLPETAGHPGLFSDLQPNLRQFTGRLDKAAMDKKVTAVILRPQNPRIGRGKLAELRAAIGRVQSAGKRVYAQLQMATARDYMLACACDEIVMPESGTLMITGIRVEMAFFKDTLDNLGVEADLIQVGNFKGAAEPLTRNSMSGEFRSQYESLIDDLYNHLVETIASDRNIEPEQVRRLIDQGLFTAAEAQAAGLIDHVAYDKEFRAKLQSASEAEHLVLAEDYGKRKNDLDLSGPFGFMNLMQLFTGGADKPSGMRKKIAIVYAAGPITTGKSVPGVFGGQTVGSDTIVEAIEKAEDDQNVAATVLRVDSPGGSAIGSDQIWKAIVDAKKPIVASMGDMAASGGYYISMGCDKIFAEPETLTGSIGVVGGKLALQGLYDKIGIHVETISRGRNSGLLSSKSRFSDSEREAWIRMMSETYLQFVSKAALGRGIPAEKMESLAAGRLWTGRQAQQHGLVDSLGSLEDAVRQAKQLAGLDADQKTDWLILPEPKSLLDQLMEGPMFGAQMRHAIDAIDPDAGIRLSDLELVRRLFTEPSVLLVPCRISVH